MTKPFLLPQFQGARRGVFGAVALLLTLSARVHAGNLCMDGTWTVSPQSMHFAAWLGASQDVTNHPITVTPPTTGCNWSAGVLAGTQTYWFSVQPYPGGSVVNIFDIASNGSLSSRSGTVLILWYDASSVAHVVGSVVISQDAAKPASLSILLPKGGETFAPGSTQTLAWSYTPSDYQGLNLISGALLVGSNGGAFGPLANVYLATATSVQWTIPIAASGTYTIQVSYQQSTDLLNQGYVVASSPPFEIKNPTTSVACPNNSGTEGLLYSSALAATNGQAPYSFSIAKGTLPAGLNLAAATGAITGKPTTAGSTFFTAQAVDSSGAVGTTSCTIVVDDCTYSIDGPEDVPGLSRYTYQLQPSAATGITWTADKPTVSFTEFSPAGANPFQILAAFQNTAADWITIKASFTLRGLKACAVKQVALVRVTVGAATFTNEGRPSTVENGDKIFLVKPPDEPAKPDWITLFTPGSDWEQFTYNGTKQHPESRKVVESGAHAFRAESSVALTSPAEKANAQQRIQVGFIQAGSDTGSAQYAGNLKRIVTTPTAITVDWLSPGGKKPNDDWPWFDESARETGTGTGTWTSNPPLSMEDPPSLSIPTFYNPNDPDDPNRRNGIAKAAETFSFVIQIGARTLDPDLGADNHYFNEANSTWRLDFAWPLAAPNQSIVTVGHGWQTPAAPAEIPVNVIATGLNHNDPFLRWIPGTCPATVCP